MLVALPVVLVLSAGLNAAATVVVARSGMYERAQMAYQFVLIWAIPIVGAAVCWSLARSFARPGGRPVLAADGDDAGDDDVVDFGAYSDADALEQSGDVGSGHA